MSRTRRLALAALSAGAVTAVSFIAGATIIAASINSPAAAGGGKGGCCIGSGQCTITQQDAFRILVHRRPNHRATGEHRSGPGSTFVRCIPEADRRWSRPFRRSSSVSIFSSSPTGIGTGACFVIPDSQFVVSSDLQLPRP